MADSQTRNKTRPEKHDHYYMLKSDAVFLDKKMWESQCLTCKTLMPLSYCKMCDKNFIKKENSPSDRIKRSCNRNKDVNKRNHYGFTKLQEAVASSDVKTARQLVSEGANTKLKTCSGTPLMWLAVKNPCLHMIEFLSKEAVCDFNEKTNFLYQNDKKYSPIHFAIVTRQPDVSFLFI